MAVNAPIWKDTYFSTGYTYSPYEYSINLNTGNEGNEVITIFHGKAWVRPGEATLDININKIAQNYLYSDLPDLRNITSATTYVNNYAYRQFYITNSAGTTVETYNFLLDWSYSNTAVTTDRSMSCPVNGHGANGMLFLSTRFVSGGPSVVTTITPSPGSGYTNTECGDYALYYLNRFGGWDSFLFEGICSKNDKYKRLQISQSFNNNTLDFQKRTYENQITESWKLMTGWLTDDESEIFATHLLSTSNAYLHNLKTNEITPVIITDQNTNYKTNKNLGRKLINYTIGVEASRTKQIIG